MKTYHINMLKLYVDRGRIEETATPGRRGIPREPRGKPRLTADVSRASSGVCSWTSWEKFGRSKEGRCLGGQC